ncbi:hypothetical protein PHAVU_004G153400 [Phaseolus vulgaris]|uniref:uncharacterized protein isoform X2 n=1 Tax=Phaseolus vulgaris TaxID=3885 RepID=UPI0035C976DA
MLLNHVAAGFCWVDPPQPDRNHKTRLASSPFRRRLVAPTSAAFHGVRMEKKDRKRRSICTADELHRVVVSNSDWKLALWRYLPSPEAPLRNHPLLLLSGVATNAIGYDLSPESSFARYMSAQGFDTWILEVRGAGLSTIGDSLEEDDECLKNLSEIDSAIRDEIGKSSASPARVMGFKDLGSPEVITKFEEMRLTRRLMDIFTRISENLAGFLNPDLLEGGKNSAIVGQIKDFNRRLRAIIEGQQLFPAQILELQDRFSTTLEEFQKQLQLIVKYDWDFDHYLEEDVPAAMEYIRAQCQPKDGKLLAIGHSMGGILLYAKLSRCCTIPAKLLLQLSSAFQEGGLRDRSGTFLYKDHLCKINVPVLAIAGDQDLICPPEAVYETVKLIPEELVTYKVFGELGGPHYAHYDLVGGRLAADELYPCITEFLIQHDML